jgi:hypothetical protein
MIDEEINLERIRQIEKFGIQSRSLIEWCVILGEEVGEANRHALEYHFSEEYPNIYNQSKECYMKNFRVEIIQIAAICIQIIQDVDKK